MLEFDPLPASLSLPHRWAEEAARGELYAVVQFAFLRPPLAELLQACADASLPLIVLKGAALAETVYPRPSLRSFGDIDVLVHPQEADLAHALLTDLGYVVEASSWSDLISGRDCEANFFRHTERGPIVTELHTDLLNNTLLRSQVHVDLDGLWKRSRPAVLAGKEARVLGPEDQLLHLCLHLAGHYFDAANSLRDIVQVCAVHAVDWPLFVSLCRGAGAATIGYCGLFGARTGGAAVPDAVLEALAPRRNRSTLDALVTARISNLDTPRTASLRFLLVWLVLDSVQARLGALGHLLFPSRAWLHAHYYHDLFDPPATEVQKPHPPGRLPVGLLLYGMHLRFLTDSIRALLWPRAK